MGPKSVIEFGVEVTEAQLKAIINFLRMRRIPFYQEPPRANPYCSIEELEADCEGK